MESIFVLAMTNAIRFRLNIKVGTNAPPARAASLEEHQGAQYARGRKIRGNESKEVEIIYGVNK
jgi:hypothetical protein